jgi:phosphotriesterase-related protein
LEGAITAAVETGTALLVHTEKGQAVEEFLALCQRRQLPLQRLILCHIDKRPDFGLHSELAQAGVLLEYDTFYRPQYQPEVNVWPLIERMAAAGLEGCIALATDMADAALWRFSGAPQTPGLPGFIENIHRRLEKSGLPAAAIAKMVGKNIAERLAFSHSYDWRE